VGEAKVIREDRSGKSVVRGDGSEVTKVAWRESRPLNALPRDDEVVKCVQMEFHYIGFPKPTGGSVAVVYPVDLEPG
jgi:hypothetical protein